MKIKLGILMALFLILSGCQLLSSDVDRQFPRETYDKWYEEEQYEVALEDVNERLEKYPNDPILHNEKGLLLYYVGQYEESLQSLDKGIELDDQMDAAYNNKALTLNELGEYEQAIVAAQKAIDMSDQEPEQFINMGNAHYGLQRYENALEYYNQALEIDDSSPFALYGKGVSLYFLMEDEQALPYLEQYIQVYPEDTDALFYLVSTHEELGEYSEAIPYLDRIIELSTEDKLYALDYKGLLLLYEGNYNEAVEAYDEMIVEFPNEAIGYYGKGVVLVQQGELDQGLDHLAQSIEIDEFLKDTAYSDPMLSSIYDYEPFIELTEY
ncbi:tetratricopeptide repeat protein [Alkalihalobacillus trypoxylicola]|uniref:Uncharacterized protein n=1 Tax=Alkalihalobacillus trypoxylicola TaxID=519424 RepID=A0A161PA80_9BACI|nr:tetratricopeptide repeat protein [Alkalihalobacillus trypoxylicola]KYG28121.1 hypothetical protein AZF04_09465 [Alkalihalobacillus trypoxylicola]